METQNYFSVIIAIVAKRKIIHQTHEHYSNKLLPRT